LEPALIALANRLNSPDAFVTAQALALAMQETPESHSGRLGSLRLVLTSLAGRLNSTEAAAVAELLVKAMVNTSGSDSTRLENMGFALASLSARMNPIESIVVAKRGAGTLAQAIENTPEKSSYRLSDLGNPLAALVVHMDPIEAAPMAAAAGKALVRAMNNLPKESDDLPRLGLTLAALGTRLTAPEASSLAARAAQLICEDMETTPDPDYRYISNSGFALAELANHSTPAEAIPLVARGAIVLMRELDGLSETDDDDRIKLGSAVTALVGSITNAVQARLFVTCILISREILPPTGKGTDEKQLRATIGKVCSILTTNELVEVLKWPFCVGEAQKLVLAELERRLNAPGEFNDNLWRFVEQAPKLGFSRKLLDAPAQRPHIKDAIKELRTIVSPVTASQKL
jgi:hypothetical protein